VLAVGLDALQHCAVDASGVSFEPSLGTRDHDRTASKELAVVASDAMDGVALWHVDRERTMASA